MARGGGDRNMPDGASRLLSEMLNDPKAFNKALNKNRKGGGKGGKGGGKTDETPDLNPPIKRAPDKMKPSGDVEADRKRLREALHDKIDEVSDERDPSTHWSGNRRRPCMSAVWDRESGKVFYNHNSKEAIDPDRLHPKLRERYDNYKDGNWNRYEADQDKHGEPGKHSESRATNQALKEAEMDYLKGERKDRPKLEDFMVENAAPNNKKPMPCCPQCTQMVDGVDGADRGWDKNPDGSKKHRTDGWTGE
ncbi:YwqJ-related putative deaminase [Glycomyces dulcitolivorans]|jgi:hypothetical protein|uniref:YwqJ-related putative deaminase n=1 Tax=Glycomyces dulcitolivorans TaxID=2200759 RepID=UPI000DD47BC7|nr:YwqJ-related putative deaminase [Glycomyces dulcitolivorans]